MIMERLIRIGVFECQAVTDKLFSVFHFSPCKYSLKKCLIPKCKSGIRHPVLTSVGIIIPAGNEAYVAIHGLVRKTAFFSRTVNLNTLTPILP